MNRKKFAVLAAAILLLAAVIVGAASLIKGYFVLWPSVQILIEGGEEQVVAAHSEYADPVVTARKGAQDLTALLTKAGNVDPAVPGEYVLTYRLSYKGKEYTASCKVAVKDMEAPQLQLNGEQQLTVSTKAFYQEAGCTATDRCDGDMTAQVSVTTSQKGETMTVTYMVIDSAGNVAQAQRIVTIRDIVPPTIVLNGAVDMYVRCGVVFNDPGCAATDDADGNLSAAVTVSGDLNTAVCGTYELTYQVADAAGNTAKTIRKVTVYEPHSDSNDRVYLTFDDGPGGAMTEQVLDILLANNVKATFFILDYGSGSRPLIQRMIDEGHTIGIHGYSHDYATIYANDEAFMQNIYLLRDKLLADFGYNATVIRFPGGSSNGVSISYCEGIMTRLTQRVQQEGFQYFDWNVSSGDAGGAMMEKEYIYNNVIQGLRRDRANVVLMHDAYGKWTTAEALQDVIDYAMGNGYVFLPITAATPAVHHGVLN